MLLSELMPWWNAAEAEREWLEFSLNLRREEEGGIKTKTKTTPDFEICQEPEAPRFPVRTWEERVAAAQATFPTTATATPKKLAAVAWAAVKQKMTKFMFELKLKLSPKDVLPSEKS
ncbi:hypothetical protein FPOAC2_02248 [Fusarium poae]|uniref:hypothetical protein n=1 Tax=Fusarium poae TaxID=36050 RepID=UPI001CE9CF02|nr:hypothetical protein FPOAC1_002159 [Fusarium poae]KAG8676160.1 hypothetical protein FPOAC1_002159 [Fusarium poae]